MDTFLFITATVILLAGIAGCVVPMLPGPPLAYASLIILQLSSKSPFSDKFLIVWLLITLAVTLLDYWVPIYGTRKFGGSRKGVWGATFGLLVGIFFFPPVGIILGPLLGALIGEFIAGKQSNEALRAAFGSFLGFIAGTLMKVIVSLVMAYYFFAGLLT